jgi:hypothetical protein
MKLRIEKAVYGGAGLAHQTEGPAAGTAVFIPFTLPNELVEAELPAQQTGSDEASLLQVLEPSEHRVAPHCVHFGECGGCHYQHADYTSQVQIKTTILRDTLERAGLSSIPEIQPHTAHPWGYRNRTRLRIAEVDGVLRIGYNRRASNNFLPIRECPIAAPLLWRAAEATQLVATENSAASRWLRTAVEVEFFTNADETKLQMTIFLRKDQPGLTPFCERMKELIPELTGAGTLLLSQSAAPRRIQRGRPLSSWGTDGLLGQPRRLLSGQSFSHRRTSWHRNRKTPRLTSVGSVRRCRPLLSCTGKKFSAVCRRRSSRRRSHKVIQRPRQASRTSHNRRVFAPRSHTTRATRTHPHGPSPRRRWRRSLYPAQQNCSTQARIRLLRSRDARARPTITRRCWLSPNRIAYD